jgi:plastocyanin
MRRRVFFLSGLTLATWAQMSCGGGGSNTPTTPTPSNPVATTTITITSAGVSPKDIQVAPGSRVTFVNNDTRSHNMTSDPHPEHTNCTEINQVGLLTPGQSRQTGNLNTVRTCGFHDHDLPATTTLLGSIVIR